MNTSASASVVTMKELADEVTELVNASIHKAIALNALRQLTDDQRVELFGDHFCKHCGKERREGEHPCQCWNDE